MNPDPLVSVIIPAYNAEAFIQDALESVLAQTCQNFEVIVVDDGSYDRTSEIVQSFIDRDDRVRLLKQPNSGVGAARNLALQTARGKYIAPIDADDIWFPQRLEKHVHCLENSDDSVGLVYSWSVYLNEAGEMTKYSPFGQLGKAEGDVFRLLVFHNFLDNASTMMYRRSCVDRVGQYDCDLKTCEDWDFYLRIAEHYQFRIVPEYLIGYRQYSGNVSSNCSRMAHFYESVIGQIYDRHPELPEYIRRWSYTVFYNNLLGKSYVSGDYAGALNWLYRILKGDPAILLRPGIYKVILVAGVGLLKQSLVSLVDQNLESQTPAKKSSQSNVSEVEQRSATATLTDIPSQAPRSRSFWKPYDLVIARRWQRLLKTT